MGKNILVASPQIEFNQLLRLSLEESGAYNVLFATSGEETLNIAENENIDLAILDANITEHSIKTLVTAIKGFNKQLKIVILPPQNNPNHPSLEGFKPDGFLSRPFFKPALLEMLDEILSQDTSPIIGREEQAETKISEIKYESLDDTMSFSNLQGITNATNNNHEMPAKSPQPESEETDNNDFLDLEEELERLITGESVNKVAIPDKSSLEQDADTEELLNDVLAQIKSQNVPEDEQTFEQELEATLSESVKVEAEQVASEIIEENNQIADDEDSNDLLKNVLAQIKAQSVLDEPKSLESELEETLSKSPEVNKVSIRPQDKPVLQTEEKSASNDLLKDVLAQIKSQAVPNDQMIEKNELESTFSAIDEEKVQDSPPEVEKPSEPQKTAASGDLLNNVLEQLKSQAVTEEKSELELELERALSQPPERIVITHIPRSVEPLDYNRKPEKEEIEIKEEPDNILNKVKAQLQAQSVTDTEAAEIQDDELKAVLDEDQEILELAPDEIAEEDISGLLKRSSLEETRPILTSFNDEMEVQEEAAEVEDGDIDTILHNVLAQLKIQSVSKDKNEDYSEEEKQLFKEFKDVQNPDVGEGPEIEEEEKPEIEAEPAAEDIFQNVLAQLEMQKSEQTQNMDALEDFELIPESSPSGLEEIHPHLTKLLKKEGTHAVVLAQNSKIISYEGELTFNDIQTLQDILSQNLDSSSRLELARFVKLGEIQDKYLFYATSILGNLSLGIIQISTIPLSKLRSHTLKTANEFAETELFISFNHDLNKDFEKEPEIEDSQIEEFEVVEEAEEAEEPEIIEDLEEAEYIEEAEEFKVVDLIEEDIKQKTINELLEEPELAETDETQEKEDWVPEIAGEPRFEQEQIEDTQPVNLKTRQNKKVFLKTGYGQISNKLIYTEKDSAFELAKREEKHQSIQIKNSKVPSIQMNEAETGSGFKDSNWTSPVFEIAKAEKDSEAGKSSEKFPFSETQAKPEIRKFSGKIAERYSGTPKEKISDTSRYKTFRDSEEDSLNKILSAGNQQNQQDLLTEKEEIDDYLKDILSSLETENEAEETHLPESEDLNNNGNGSLLKEYLKEDESAELETLSFDPEFEKLLADVREGESFSNSKDFAEINEQAAPFSDDNLLEEALQKISSRFDSDQDSLYTIDEETDGQLIQPSEDIMPPKKLTEDDLYVVANADGLLEDFLDKSSPEERTDTQEEGFLFEDQDEIDQSVRINGESFNMMDDIYKLFEESATGNTSPIRLSSFKTSREDEFEEYFNEKSDQKKDLTQTEKIQHSFSDELKFLEALDTRTISEEPKSPPVVPIQERAKPATPLSQEKPKGSKTENSSKFDTKKVILEVLSQMGKTEDDNLSSNREEDFPPQSVFSAEKTEAPISFDEFENELEQLSNSGGSYRLTDQQDSPAKDSSSWDPLDGFDSLNEDQNPEENDEDTPTAPVELEREKTADDYLADLLPESGQSTASMMNGFPIYTCILVPRLSDYSLTSKYSKALKDAMNQLSQAFGWELDNLIVQPTYMRWTVKVPPEISQGFIVRKVRQFTSDRLFTKFPELSKVNPSENFWAKGYLVVSGTEPPAPEFLDDFIQKNRRPKGILNK